MDQILQILIQNGYIDEAGAKDLADLSKTESKPIRRLVIDQGILDEDSLLAAMAAYQDAEAIDLAGMTIPEIFAAHDEAFFRGLEHQADCRGRHVRDAGDVQPRRSAHFG